MTPVPPPVSKPPATLLAAVRTHGAERAIRREHESLMVEWARAARMELARPLRPAEQLATLMISMFFHSLKPPML